MPRPILLLGTSLAAFGLLACGIALNLYLAIAAGVVGFSAAAWIATEDVG